MILVDRGEGVTVATELSRSMAEVTNRPALNGNVVAIVRQCKVIEPPCVLGWQREATE